MEYNFNEIEKKWQQYWKDNNTYKVDIDESEEIAMAYGIMSVPTLVIFKNGKEASRMIGVQPKAAILDAIKRA